MYLQLFKDCASDAKIQAEVSTRMPFPSMSKLTVFFRASIWYHFLKFLDLRDEHSEFNFKTFYWFRHPIWKENSFKNYFFIVGVKVDVVVRGGFSFYGTEGYTISCTPALGPGKATCALQCHKLVLSGWCMAMMQQKSRCDTYETWSFISQFQKVNSLRVTHKCRVMEDLLGGIVWPLTSLHRTIDGLQTYHLEWSVMGGCWIICFWTLSYGAKSNGFCRCECVK